MPTINESTILASGGDYTTLALWEADTDNDLVAADVQEVALLGRNTVEIVTITGAVTDATRNRVVKSYFGDNIGRRSLYERADCVYGAVTITDEFVGVEDVAIARGSAGGIIHNGSAATTVNVRRVWVRSATSSGHGFRADNTHADSAYDCDACVAASCSGESNAGCGFISATGVGAFNLTNCLAYDSGGAGVRRDAGTLNSKNNYSVGNDATQNYRGTISHTTDASDDGDDGTAQVTVAQWARACSRLASMLAYGTFENEPTGQAGKIDRAAWYRRGDTLGALAGDAAIASGLLTGTTGGITYAAALKASIDTMSIAVKATMPATPASRGLIQSKATGDSVNRIDLTIGAGGKLTLVTYDNTGAITADGSTLEYTPDADQLAGTHVYAGRVHDGNVYLYIDRVEVATSEYAGTRDATDTHATVVGGNGTLYLGTDGSCSSWGEFTGATVPPDLPLPYYSDGLGVLDDFRLTEKSHQKLKWGGTAAGTPERDAAGKIIGPRSMIGAHIGDREAAVGVM